MAILYRARLQELLTPLLARKPWLAVGIGLLREGEQQVECFGAAAPDTVYEIASVTKTFVALLLARMVVEGRVRLDAPVREYLDAAELPATIPGELEITLLDLATHSSGLPKLPGNLRRRDPRDPYVGHHANDLYAELWKSGLGVPADASYKYTNFGYGLLGYALARAADMSFAECIERYVCAPLGLTATTVATSEVADDVLVQGYNMLNRPTPPWHYDVMAGCGALRSNLPDMLRYLTAHLEKPTEMKAALELVEKPVRAGLPGMQMALGWNVVPNGALWHNGGTYGYSSFATFCVETGVAYAVLVNWFTMPRFPADTIAMAVGQLLRSEQPPPLQVEAAMPQKCKYAAQMAVLRGVGLLRG